MRNEHMYLSLLVRLDALQRLSFQNELCSLRDSIAREYDISPETIQDDFESMATCAKHALPVGDLSNVYPTVQAWFCFYRNKGL